MFRIKFLLSFLSIVYIDENGDTDNSGNGDTDNSGNGDNDNSGNGDNHNSVNMTEGNNYIIVAVVAAVGGVSGTILICVIIWCVHRRMICNRKSRPAINNTNNNVAQCNISLLEIQQEPPAYEEPYSHNKPVITQQYQRYQPLLPREGNSSSVITPIQQSTVAQRERREAAG